MFEDLAAVQAEFGVRFCLIGATARDVWFRDGGHTPPLRATNDIDVTVAVPTHEAWEQVRDFLTQNKNYYPKAGNPIKLFKKISIGDRGYEAELDILPIGGIENHDREVVLSGKDGNLQTLGMQEVYDQAMSIEIDAHFRGTIATIPQICLLKLVSYGNNPERRNHDKGDILAMARRYFDLESDLVYDQQFDILTEYDGSGNTYNHQIGSHVLGREIQAVAKQTPELFETITQTIYQLKEEDPNEEVWKCLSAGVVDPNLVAPGS